MAQLFYVYSGGNISRAVDSLGNIFRAFEARHIATNQWGFWITKNGVPTTTTPITNHGGSISNDGTWIAHIDDGKWLDGAIPGWNV